MSVVSWRLKQLKPLDSRALSITTSLALRRNKMRASLARTLPLKPPVFLFDEPFGAVDEITREHLNDETQRLFQSEGFAGLFITHSIAEAVFMSTKVMVMSARPGRIVAEFDVPFDYAKPELRFDPEFAVERRDFSRTERFPPMTITQDDQQVSKGDDGSSTNTSAPVLGGKKRRRSGSDLARTFLPPVLLGALIVGAWYYVSYGPSHKSADSCCALRMRSFRSDS